MSDTFTRKSLKEFLQSLADEGVIESDAVERITLNIQDRNGNGSIGESDDLGIDPFTGKPLLFSDVEESMSLLTEYLFFLMTNYEYIRGSLAGGTDTGKPANPFHPSKAAAEASSHFKGDVVTRITETLATDEATGVDEPTGDDNYFAPSNETLGDALLNWKNSKKFDQLDDYNLSDIVEKAASATTTPTSEHNHRLLGGIKGAASGGEPSEFDDPTTSHMDAEGQTLRAFPASHPEGSDDNPNTGNRAVNAIQQILKSSNRFSSAAGKAWAPNSPARTSTADIDSSEETRGQRDFGYHRVDDSAAPAISLDDLKKIGHSLTMRAMGVSEDVKIEDLQKLISEATDFTEAANVLDGELINTFPAADLEGSTAMPTVSTHPEGDLSAQNAEGGPEGLRDNRGEFLNNWSGNNASTRAQAFSSFTPFDGVGNKVVVAQAAACIVALSSLADSVLDTVLGGYSGLSSMSVHSLGRGPFFMGEHTQVEEELATFVRFVLVPTTHPYADCVAEGFKSLFGDTQVSLKGKGGSLDSVAEKDIIYDSPGFWISIARSIILSTETATRLGAEIATTTSNSKSDEDFFKSLRMMQRSRVIGFLNAMAKVGDIAITSSLNDGNPWDVDQLPDTPATRVMKSRTNSGQNSLALAWRGNSLPGLYVFPQPILEATLKMGVTFAGPNPLKAALGTGISSKAYIAPSGQGNTEDVSYIGGSRIPNDVVKVLEDQLDAEYVPFYFHDLRTNEIVAFHAFIDSLTDSYSPSYNSQTPYGRMDPVHIYKSTTRSISLSFTIAATSREDFDEMWWKINKLTTMVYPMYTKGTLVETPGSTLGKDKSTFIQPFSQLIGASPMIRMRVGDVVKSNYSKFNIARIFGIGEPEVVIGYERMPTAQTVGKLLGKLRESPFGQGMDKIMLYAFYAVFGSPLAWLPRSTGNAAGDVGIESAIGVLQQFLVNGFANPLGLFLTTARLKDPENFPLEPGAVGGMPGTIRDAGADVQALGGIGSTGTSNGLRKMGIVGDYVFVKASTDAPQGGYKRVSDGTRFRFNRPLLALVQQKAKLSNSVGSPGDGKMYHKRRRDSDPKIENKHFYKVKIVDNGAPTSPETIKGEQFYVNHSDVMPTPTSIFQFAGLMDPVGILQGAAQALANAVSAATGVPADSLGYFIQTPEASFLDHRGDEGNPIVKAFNATKGRGLAGFIGSLGYTWIGDDITWETDWGSRAPKLCKVTMRFNPVHDIPPGLDESGFTRAPIYNVGEVARNVGGDVYDDHGLESQLRFTRAAVGIQPKVKRSTEGNDE